MLVLPELHLFENSSGSGMCLCNIKLGWCCCVFWVRLGIVYTRSKKPERISLFSRKRASFLDVWKEDDQSVYYSLLQIEECLNLHTSFQGILRSVLKIPLKRHFMKKNILKSPVHTDRRYLIFFFQSPSLTEGSLTLFNDQIISIGPLLEIYLTSPSLRSKY